MIHLFKRNISFARRFLCSVLLLSVCNTNHLTSVVFADEESARKAAAEGKPGAEIWKNIAVLGVFTAGETRSFQGIFLDKHHILTSPIPIWEHKKQNGTCVITVMVKKSRNSLEGVQRVLDQVIFFSDYTQKKCSKETYVFADPTVAEDARENKLFASAHGVFKRYAGARVCGDRFRKVIGPSICILKLNEGVDYMQDLWPLLGFFQEPAKPAMPESLQASAATKAKEKFLWSELGATKYAGVWGTKDPAFIENTCAVNHVTLPPLQSIQVRYKPGKNVESSHELLFAQFDCEHGNPAFVTRTVAVESAGVTKRPCAIPLKDVIGSPIWQRRGGDWRIVGVMCDIQRPRTRTHLVDVVGAEHCTAKKSSATAAAGHKLAQLAEANGLTQPVWIVGVRLTESLLERIKTGLPSVMHHPDLHKVGDTEEVAAQSKPKKTKKVASHNTTKDA